MQPPLHEDRRLVIREGEEGGVLSQTEFKIASFASEYKLKKRASNSLIEMVTSRDFNPQDIQVSSIQQIEKLAMKANEGGTVARHNFWKEGDGDQDVILIVRSLGVIIQDLVASLESWRYGGSGLSRRCALGSGDARQRAPHQFHRSYGHHDLQ